MITMDVTKELIAKIKLPEMDIEVRILITPKGEVEMSFMPWSQWNLSGESFDQLVEDYNLLKSQVKLSAENHCREQLMAPPRKK